MAGNSGNTEAGGMNFESRSHQALYGMVMDGNPARLTSVGTSLFEAAHEISKIAEELNTHLGGLQWHGEGADALREWSQATVKESRKLARYTFAAGDAMSTAGEALRQAQAMPKPNFVEVEPSPSQTQRPLIADADHQEAVRQLERLSSYYATARSDMKREAPPNFRPASGFVPKFERETERPYGATTGAGAAGAGSGEGVATTAGRRFQDAGSRTNDVQGGRSQTHTVAPHQFPNAHTPPNAHMTVDSVAPPALPVHPGTGPSAPTGTTPPTPPFSVPGNGNVLPPLKEPRRTGRPKELAGGTDSASDRYVKAADRTPRPGMPSPHEGRTPGPVSTVTGPAGQSRSTPQPEGTAKGEAPRPRRSVVGAEWGTAQGTGSVGVHGGQGDGHRAPATRGPAWSGQTTETGGLSGRSSTAFTGERGAPMPNTGQAFTGAGTGLGGTPDRARTGDGRRLAFEPGGPAGGPRGTVLGEEHRPPVGGGSSGAAPAAGRGAAGAKHGRPNGNPAEFTPGGSGLVRTGSSEGGRQAAAHAAPHGTGALSRPHRRAGERPDYVQEERETWVSGQRTTVPPVIQ